MIQSTIDSQARLNPASDISTQSGNTYRDSNTKNATQPPNLSSTDKKYKIMIVEDEDDPRFVFTSILSTVQEFEVLESTDGNDCLTKLEANKDVDLVLLDIVMPTMDGIQTLTEIKKSPERYGNAKVVMLSNLGGPVAFETAINLGAIDFWMKIDTDPTMLLSKIKDVLTNPNYQPEADISNRII